MEEEQKRQQLCRKLSEYDRMFELEAVQLHSESAKRETQFTEDTPSDSGGLKCRKCKRPLVTVPRQTRKSDEPITMMQRCLHCDQM